MRRCGLALTLLLVACGGGTATPGAPTDADAPPDAGPPDAAPDAELPPSRAWFVEAGARDGDGSREAPFGDPATAYAVARAGDVVLLLPGEHPSPPLPPPGIELAGSGPEVTTVAGPLAIDRPARLVAMAIAGGDPPLTVTPGGRAELEDLAITADGVAIRVEGALIGRRIAATGAPGLQVEGGADASLRGGALRGVGGPAAVGIGRLVLEAVALSSTVEALRVDAGESRLEPALIDGATIGARVLGGRLDVVGGVVSRALTDGGVGAAIRVTGGEAHVSDLVIEASDRGLRVDAEGVLHAEGVVIRDPTTDGVSLQGGEATIDGLLVESPRNAGVAVLDRARLDLADARVVDVGRVGALVDGATLTARGLVVERSDARGLTLTEAVADIDGLLVIEAADVGIQITDPVGAVTIANAEIQRCATTGVAVFGDSGAVRLESVVVEGTTPGDAALADGVHIFRARVGIAGLVSRDNGGAGLLVEQSAATIAGGTLSGNVDPGLVVLEPVDTIGASELVIEGNGGAGALAVAGTLELTDSVVRETRVALAVGPGHGVFATAGAQVVMRGGASLDNAGSGVALDPVTRGVVGGVRLAGNAGYGLLASCGAMVDEPEPNTMADNGLGDRAVCDR